MTIEGSIIPRQAPQEGVAQCWYSSLLSTSSACSGWNSVVVFVSPQLREAGARGTRQRRMIMLAWQSAVELLVVPGG